MRWFCWRHRAKRHCVGHIAAISKTPARLGLLVEWLQGSWAGANNGSLYYLRSGRGRLVWTECGPMGLSVMTRSRVFGIASVVACVVVALTALIALAQAPPRPQPSTPSRPSHVPFDPTAPAIREENELRKGAEGLQSGANPFPEFVKKVGPGLYEIGTVVLDMNVKQAKVPGRINMNRGIIANPIRMRTS